MPGLQPDIPAHSGIVQATPEPTTPVVVHTTTTMTMEQWQQFSPPRTEPPRWDLCCVPRDYIYDGGRHPTDGHLTHYVIPSHVLTWYDASHPLPPSAGDCDDWIHGRRTHGHQCSRYHDPFYLPANVCTRWMAGRPCQSNCEHIHGTTMFDPPGWLFHHQWRQTGTGGTPFVHSWHQPLRPHYAPPNFEYVQITPGYHYIPSALTDLEHMALETGTTCDLTECTGGHGMVAA